MVSDLQVLSPEKLPHQQPGWTSASFIRRLPKGTKDPGVVPVTRCLRGKEGGSHWPAGAGICFGLVLFCCADCSAGD
jgi:hypothetical protein